MQKNRPFTQIKFYLSSAFMVILMVQSNFSNAQLSGVKTIPGDYIGIAAAVTDLNSQGVGPGGVTFNVASGHIETLSDKMIMIATGTVANPVTFQKNGAGANPLLISYTGTVATPSVLADGFWVFAGSDYVTIDGIDLQESAANTTTTTVMEFGFGLFKASDSDGCQNNIIKNCTISLNRMQNTAWTAPGHNGSVGIAVLNGLYTATGAVTVTSPNGSNSFNKFFANTIQNCNAGIICVGFADVSPFALSDTNNDIGGNNVASGNSILNFGGGSAVNPATGVFTSAQWGLNVSYNTINNNNGAGVNHPSTMRGVFMSAATSASANCNFNAITLTGGAITSDLTFIENGSGSTPAGNTININNNTLTGSYLTATTGAFRGIYNNTATPEFLNIQNNVISNLDYSVPANTGTGVIYGIHTSGSNAAMTINATGNLVANITRRGSTGGTTIGVFISAGATNMSVNVNNNTVQNLSIEGTGTASTMYGIQTATGTIAVNNNLVENLTCLKTTGTSAMYGIYNIASPVDENFNNNIIRNLTHNGTGIVYGLYANTTTGTRTVSGNLIHDISGSGTTVAGLAMLVSSPTIFNNKIYGISSASSASPIVSGILLSSVSVGGTANIYNNYIGDLRAPSANSATAGAPSVRGINITSVSTTATIEVSNNTVYLNASSIGLNFGTAGLFATTSATSTTANLVLKNNVIVNLSSPNGASNAVAYQRSSIVLTNYDLNSNNNLFYAGIPSSQNLIFFDGTNSDLTLTDFKCRVASRETSSVTENPTFLSTIGSNASFLHLNAAVPTQIESGGTVIAGITDDFDGDIRQGNGGYLGSGIAPDLGADEGNFIPSDQVGPNIDYNLMPNTICISNTDFSATITDVSGVNVTIGTKPRLWFKKASENNVLAATNTSADNGWKWVEATNTNSPFTFNFDYSLLTSPAAYGDVIEYFVVAQDLAGVPNVGVNIANFNACSTASSVALASNLFPVSNTASFTIINPPSPVTTTASPAAHCLIGNSVIALNTNLGAEYQWESSPAGANTWTPISGANGMNYTAVGLTVSTDFRSIISCNSIPVASVSPSDIATVTVSNPEVLTTTPGSACTSGSTSVLLSATKNTGSVLNWYDSPSSLTPLATGDNFNTPLISSTTTYYVAASQGGSNFSVGPQNTSIGTTSASNIAIGTQRMFFNVTADATIVSIDIFPTATIGSNGSIQIRNNTQTVIANIPYTTTVTGGALQTIPINQFLPIGTGYEIGQGTAISLNRNTTGAIYPYTSPAINITGNTFDPVYYYFFYNWQVSTGCESARVPVEATILPIATGTDVVSACGSLTWIDGNTYTTNNNTATHTLLGAAANGCDSIVTLNLTINQNPTGTTSSTSATCAASDGSATVTPANGLAPYTFVWSNAQTNATATGLAAGTYSVTITDDNGCIASASATVTALSGSLSTNTFVNDATCTASDGSATVNITGGTAPFITTWSTGANGTTLSNVAAGTYSVTVTDASGCISTSTATIAANASNIVATVTTTDAICTSANGSALASNTGGTAPFSYSWSNGGITNNITGLVGGTYSVIITDNNGCQGTASGVVLTSSGNLSLGGTTTQELCTSGNGTATVTTTNGAAPFSYSWNTGDNTSTVNGLSAGTYSVTVTDANGCTETATVTVGTNSGSLTVSTTTTNATCLASNGTATATPANGSAPFSYVWNNGQTAANANGLASGNYTVNITDANGCVASASATVGSNVGNLASTVTSTDVTSIGGSDGSIDLTTTGGTAPFSYSWSNGAITEDVNGLIAGTYTVTVTDANGCVSSESVIVNQPNVGVDITAANAWVINMFPNPAETQTLVAVELGANGDIRIRLVNNLGQIIQSTEYSNVVSVQHSVNVSELPAGIYMVEITSNGMLKTERLVVKRK